MKAFYGSRISPHMTKTPEGFLICHSVPICRTGEQEYLPREIGVEEEKRPIITVLRTPEEVFKPAAIASFEGKPVTDDHPPVPLDSSNYSTYTKGAVQNVHRGTGEDDDKLVCDIVLYDSVLISKVEAGKREISCGYDCKYIPNGDGTYHQADIIGNHVAIVDSGRAGHDVAIKDAKPKGGTRMAKKSILQRMFAAFVKDADPDEIQEAAKAVNDAENGPGPDDEPEAPVKKDDDLQDVMDAIDDLNERISAIQAGRNGNDTTEDEDPEDGNGMESMDALEDELDPKTCQGQDPTTDADEGEESVTVDPEDIQDDEDPEPAPENPENQIARDNAIALRIIRGLKPIVASMPDPQRRRCSDAMSRAVRKALRKNATQPLPGGYGALTHRRVSDAAYNKQGDPRAFGEACAKMNPHLNRGGK
ncbi:DUF2213 domain-containing protein [uncultured Acidaminococcus sp.]|uniref:DUF2213 domain-containing protein n=1 Tax=uncultured Acidaminococcus sp. TaxID=352152 RepID=UPI002597B4E4|nr:DUF2213 domain-containing protein [uncultured Acidaminococcus sp.]